ncbi:hypothetical protein D3OALGB2SA_2073 [Olavius algarvensis associated proteobacterium Delta 3]|nr:hypothetical protein D3OALGB2SA_2073 [Olavius algarvensis associated proteobacterium Delta 3]
MPELRSDATLRSSFPYVCKRNIFMTTTVQRDGVAQVTDGF